MITKSLFLVSGFVIFPSVCVLSLSMHVHFVHSYGSRFLIAVLSLRYLCFSVAAMSDLTGLVASAAAAAIAKTPATNLRSWDLSPNAFLNSMGESCIGMATESQVHASASKGNKRVAFHSEIYDVLPERQGVSFSRLAQILKATIVKLEEEPNYAMILDGATFKKAMAEAAKLKPHLIVLDGGFNVNGSKEEKTINQLNYAKSSKVVVPPDSKAVGVAAVALCAWLRVEKSTLRSLIAFLSGSGLFFSAQCHEKVMRSAIKETSMSDDAAITACCKRLCTVAAVVKSKDDQF